MTKVTMILLGVLAAGMSQFGILASVPGTSLMAIIAGTVGAMGIALAGLLTRLPESPWTGTDRRQGGFAHLGIFPLLVIVAMGAFVLLTQGCAGPQAAVPRTMAEQIEAANLLVDKLSDGIVDMTCTQFKKGQCVEPGKPLMPDDAIKAHADVERAHAALMVTGTIPLNGVGECIGKQRTQSACLMAASALLTEVDRMLIARKGVK